MRAPSQKSAVSKFPFLALVGSVRPLVQSWAIMHVLAALAVAAFGQAPRLTPAQPSVWPGFTRGEAQAVRVSGNYAYLGLSHGGLSGGLAVVDIGNPAKPVPVGGLDLAGVVCGLDVAGSYAYLATHSGGVQVIDVSTATNPVCVGSFATGGFAWDIRVVGRFAYVAVTDIGLVVLDVSDPAHPAVASTLTMTGWLRKLQVAGNVIFLEYSDRLEIVTVSNDTNLTHAATYTPPAGLGAINDLQVAGHYAYVVGGGLEVLDVGEPSAPVVVATIDPVGFGGTALRLAGHYAYATSDPVTIKVFDVADPLHPVEAGEVDTGEFPQDLEVSGQYAYVAAQLTGLGVIDVSDPTKPTRIGGYGVSGSTASVRVAGHYAYLDDGYAGLEIIDLSNLARPTWAGGYLTGGQLTGLQLAGQTLYLSDRDLGLLILDSSQPANPQLAGQTTNLGIVNGFEVVGSSAYLACNSGLSIVDVSDRSHPRLTGSCAPSGFFGLVAAVHVVGHYAYVAIDRDMSIDIGVINVTDPTRPVFLASLAYSAAAWMMGLQEAGDYLLAADSTPLLEIYEKGGPTNFVLAATFPTLAPVRAITVASNYAYVSEGSAGVQVIDISSPTNPIAIRTLDTHAPADHFCVAENVVYIAEAGKGLVIVPPGPGIQFTLQVDGVPSLPCTIEYTTQLNSTPLWTTLLTTNSPRMPFWIADTNVQAGAKFYRVHQP